MNILGSPFEAYTAENWRRERQETGKQLSKLIVHLDEENLDRFMAARRKAREKNKSPTEFCPVPTPAKTPVHKPVAAAVPVASTLRPRALDESPMKLDESAFIPRTESSNAGPSVYSDDIVPPPKEVLDASMDFVPHAQSTAAHLATVSPTARSDATSAIGTWGIRENSLSDGRDVPLPQVQGLVSNTRKAPRIEAAVRFDLDESMAGDESSEMGTYGRLLATLQAPAAHAVAPEDSINDFSMIGPQAELTSIFSAGKGKGRSLKLFPHAQSTQFLDRTEDISMFTSTVEPTNPNPMHMMDVDPIATSSTHLPLPSPPSSQHSKSPSKRKRTTHRVIPEPKALFLAPRDRSNVTQFSGPSPAASATQSPACPRSTTGRVANKPIQNRPRPVKSDTMDCSNITSPGNSDADMEEAVVPPTVEGKRKEKPSDILTKKRNAPSKPPRKLSTSAVVDKIKANTAASEKEKQAKKKPHTKAELAKRAKEELAKDKMMTPVQYAEKLNKEWSDGKRKVVPRDAYLKGKSVVLLHTDLQLSTDGTRGKMLHLVKHGATLLPTYDPLLTTHIIAAVKDMTLGQIIKCLGITHINDVTVPASIPMLHWDWIGTGFGKLPTAQIPDVMEPIWHAKYAILSNRVPPAPRALRRVDDSRKFKDDSRLSKLPTIYVDSIEDERSHEDRSHESHSLILPPSLGEPDEHQQYIPDADDPLAQFYDKARAMKDEGVETDYSSDGQERDYATDEEEDKEGYEGQPAIVVTASRAKGRGWTCDGRKDAEVVCPNEDVIQKLQQLQKIHTDKTSSGDRWRAYSYTKSIGSIRAYPTRIRSLSEAAKIPNVGAKTAAKIMEIIKTGELRRIGYENTPEVQIMGKFAAIYNVGQIIASKWYAAGCRSLDDVRKGKFGVTLSSAQKIGLQYYDDLQDRMPREEAKAIFDAIKPLLLKIDPKLFIEIMGSYRRGKKDCGDIDILLTRPTDDGKNHAGILPKVLHALHKAKILSEDLTLPEDTGDLEGVYRGLCVVPGKENAKQRRIDILTVPYKAKGAALLYYTGDDIFNRSMRLKANKMEYSLNQRGLYEGVIRSTKNRTVKTNIGTVIASETEEQIFEILGVPWQEPHQRVRG